MGVHNAGMCLVPFSITCQSIILAIRMLQIWNILTMKTSAKLKQEHIFQRSHINDHIMTLSLCATCMCDCLICGSPVVPCQPSLPSAPFPRAPPTTFNIHVVSRVCACVCVCEVPCAVLLNLLANPATTFVFFSWLVPPRVFVGAGVNPGTTCTVALLRDGIELVVASVGDSRAMLCRKGKVLKLTVDHTPERKDEKER